MQQQKQTYGRDLWSSDKMYLLLWLKERGENDTVSGFPDDLLTDVDTVMKIHLFLIRFEPKHHLLFSV